jgi:MFS family permease
MSDVDLALLGTAFLWVYGLSSPLAGYLGDRFRRKSVVVWSLMLFSLMTLANGFAAAGWHLIAFRGVLGISEALYMPAAVALISDHHLSRTRATAISFHQSSLLMGGIIGGTFAGFMGDHYGWRPTFFVLGSAGFLLSLVLTLTLRDGSQRGGGRPGTADNDAGGAKLGATMVSLMRNPSVGAIVINSFAVSMATWVILAWMPSHLHDHFGLSLAESGFNATVWASIAGMVAMPLGGLWADWWAQRNCIARAWVQFVGLTVLVPAMLVISWAPSLPFLLFGLALYGVGQGMWNAGNMPILCDVVRTAQRSTAYGLFNLAGIFGGGISVLLFGALSRRIGVSAVFFSLAIVLTLAIGVVCLLALRLYRADRIRCFSVVAVQS